MDRSEDERKPAQRAGDQSETEGSRTVSRPSASVIKKRECRRIGELGAKRKQKPRDHSVGVGFA
jgi:hypothetical protein